MKNIAEKNAIEMTDEEFEAIISNTLNSKTYTEDVKVTGRFSFLR